MVWKERVLFDELSFELYVSEERRVWKHFTDSFPTQIFLLELFDLVKVSEARELCRKLLVNELLLLKKTTFLVLLGLVLRRLGRMILFEEVWMRLFFHRVEL
mmetsp:Transcript_7342/g.6570  ORF Transcript_7342/g.6570 Transcript_7342/m.6570 type:complete len:102 (-) Transcript_7342:10-315(-)